MKKFNFGFLLLLSVILFSACNYSGREEKSSNSSNSVNLNEIAETRFGLDSLLSPKRKIIHTADISCRVDDVLKVTTILEERTRELSGIVAASSMRNQELSRQELPYSRDSIQEVMSYQRSATLVLRIPAGRRDSLVNMLPGLATFIDTRRLLHTDATLSYVSNYLKSTGNAAIVSTSLKKAAKAKDFDLAVARSDKGIDQQIDNYRIDDAANYSTVTLELYQPVQTFRSVTVNSSAAAKVPFGAGFTSSLDNGWYMFQRFINFLVAFWPLWLLIGVILALRNFLKRKFAVQKVISGS